jgi:RNA polymerase sigma-70 factor (ECF subfamily)
METGGTVRLINKPNPTTSASDLSEDRSNSAHRNWELGPAIAAETPVLLATARLILLDEAQAWDVVQTTIEIALRRGERLRDPGALRTWLLVILSRQVLRLRRVRHAMSLDVGSFELPSDPGPTLDRVTVRDALAQLPVRTRSAVVLHHMVGMSIAEVATTMHVSENTSKSQIRIGMTRLREVLLHE